MTQYSRLSHKMAQENKRKFFLSMALCLGILFIFLKFGIPFFVNATVFLSGNKKDTEEKKTTIHTFIIPPLLHPLASATDSATLIISGTAKPDQKIHLYMNTTLTDTTTVDSKGDFVFSHITLSKGANRIYTTAMEDGQESKPSDTYTVQYTTNPPTLSVDTPSEGASFSKDQNTVSVTGKTDATSKITVNDHWAIVDNEGKYTYLFPLQDGDNEIKVVATDQAGNKTEMIRKVHYSQ